MARRPTPVLSSRLRDAVTGEPLCPGTLRLHIPPDPDLRPRPIILHRSAPEGRLGGKLYSVDMLRYLKHTRPASIVAAERAWNHWWTNPWAEGELYAAFPQPAVWAVLQVVRDGADMRAIAAEVDHTITWIVRFEQRMAAYIRRLLPIYAA